MQTFNHGSFNPSLICSSHALLFLLLDAFFLRRNCCFQQRGVVIRRAAAVLKSTERCTLHSDSATNCECVRKCALRDAVNYYTPGAQKTFAEEMPSEGWHCTSSFMLLSLLDVVLSMITTGLRGLSRGISPPGITDCVPLNAEDTGAASPPPMLSSPMPDERGDGGGDGGIVAFWTATHCGRH